MGQGQSKTLDTLLEDTAFTQEEILRLHKRFKKLDTDRSGAVSVTEFLSLPQIASNPLAKRFIQVFDEDDSGTVDFLEFLKGISDAMGKKNTRDSLKFAFKVYDLDNDGFISTGELYLVLQMMVGSNLPPRQLQELVDKTMIQADRDGDDKISYDEFEHLILKGSVDVNAVIGALSQI